MNKVVYSHNSQKERRARKILRYTNINVSGLASSKAVLITAALFLFIVIELLAMTVYAKEQVAYSSEVPLLPTGSESEQAVDSAAEASQPNADSQVAKDSLNSSYPYKIQIPKIGAQAGVLALGMNNLGEMAVPNNLYHTSWYKNGAAPGQNGSAVIAGHYGAPYQRGIFRNLDALKEGDNIKVTKQSGEVYTYSVYKVMHVNNATAPMQEIFNKSDGAYLNLITCFGSWNSSSLRYDKRIVVFSKLVQ